MLHIVLLTIFVNFELWLLGCTVATIGAIVVWWVTSALAPLSVVALVVALVSSAVLYEQCMELAKSTRFLAKVTYPPVPVTLMYKFYLELTETVWYALGLTPDERALVKAQPTGSITLIVEKWGASFTRWRVRKHESGRIFEETIDYYYGDDGYDIIPVWCVELGAERVGAASVELAWRHIAGREALTFAAFGGRFGGWKGPIGDTEPSPEHTLFRIPMTLDVPRGGTVARQEFDESLARYRVLGQQAVDLAGYDAKRVGYDVYFCDELKSKGFRWSLVRCDCRPKFMAKVLEVRHAVEGEVGRILVELHEAPFGTLWASLADVEPDDTGETSAEVGEWVEVAFDDHLDRAERIWRIGLAPSRVRNAVTSQ